MRTKTERMFEQFMDAWGCVLADGDVLRNVKEKYVVDLRIASIYTFTEEAFLSAYDMPFTTPLAGRYLTGPPFPFLRTQLIPTHSVMLITTTGIFVVAQNYNDAVGKPVPHATANGDVPLQDWRFLSFKTIKSQGQRMWSMVASDIIVLPAREKVNEAGRKWWHYTFAIARFCQAFIGAGKNIVHGELFDGGDNKPETLSPLKKKVNEEMGVDLIQVCNQLLFIHEHGDRGVYHQGYGNKALITGRNHTEFRA